MRGQYCAVALMDARSIAATAANQGVITAATDLDYQIPDLKYCFDGTVYKKRVYYGYGKADASVRLVTGPNIVDWPPMDELHDNILMRFSAVIHDPVTTTDELIPSGDTASYRSNPIRLAEYALCRRVPGYAGYCRSIQVVEEERKQGKMPEELVRVMDRFGIDEDMIAGTGYGSCLFANKPGTVRPESKRPHVRRFLEELPISVSSMQQRDTAVIVLIGALFLLLWMEGKNLTVYRGLYIY